MLRRAATGGGRAQRAWHRLPVSRSDRGHASMSRTVDGLNSLKAETAPEHGNVGAGGWDTVKSAAYDKPAGRRNGVARRARCMDQRPRGVAMTEIDFVRGSAPQAA